MVFSPFLIYYCFSKTQYILSLKNIEDLTQKENIYLNSEFIEGAGLINATIEIINDYLLLLSANNQIYLLYLNFDDKRNLKDMNLRKLNVFQGKDIEFHSVFIL